MPRSVKLKPELKKSIKALLPRNGFASQQSLAEHLGISRDVVSRFLNGKPVERLNAEEICRVLGCDIREVTFIEDNQSKETKIDWGEATNNSVFFDLSARTKELETLKKSIIEDKCRIILIEGMKGMGKAHLSYQLVQQIKNSFDYVIIRSLGKYESIDELLNDWLSFLYDEEDVEELEIQEKINKLIVKLESSRCLLILTNIEGKLDKESLVFEESNYELLSKNIAEKQKKSCLVVTSSIEPKKTEKVLRENKFARRLKIEPLPVEAIKNIFNSIGSFEGTEENWKELTDTYKGNPFILVNVAHNISHSFGGNINNFINFKDFVFNGIEDFIKEQLESLSDTEINVMYWLAIYRNAISLFELKDIMEGLFSDQILIITKHLKLRFFVESKEEGVLIQPPMIRDYLIKQLINDMTKEIIDNSFNLLNQFPLFLPTATIKIREDQDKFILKPIIEKLKTKFNTERAN